MSKKKVVVTEREELDVEVFNGDSDDNGDAEASAGVNAQVTDSVTATGVEVQGLSSSVAAATGYLSTCNGLALAAHNAVVAQANSQGILHASTVMAVSALYDLPNATDPQAKFKRRTRHWRPR